METRKLRWQKRDNHSNGGSLSELPDEVLSHVVSFLPTKEAVRTSILSKSWKYIWTSIPNLDLVQGRSTVNFVSFVERAFLLRGSSKITSLYIKLGDRTYDSCRIESWLSAAVGCNVQVCKLNLLDYVKGGLFLPLGFASCSTLTDLTVIMFGMLKLPSRISLFSLKKLELICVTFPNGHSAQQLFSGCPVLESLLLKECNWENVKVPINILSPRLQVCSMFEAQLNFMDEDSPSGSMFVIHGSGLKKFSFSGQFHFDYCFLNSSAQLEEVSIYIDPWASTYINPWFDFLSPIQASTSFLRLLRSVSYVQELILKGISTWILANCPKILDHMPTFTNLRRLELQESFELLPTLTGVVILMKMLRNVPRLEYLALSEGIVRDLGDHSREEDAILNPVPPCFVYHLAFIDVHVWKGDDVVMNALKVLLKKAMVLKRMVIHFDARRGKVDDEGKFFEEPLKLPRASKDCSIQLNYI